jgi:hypothetical protein
MKKLSVFIFLIFGLLSCKERFTGINYSVPPNGRLVIDSQFKASGVPSSFQKMILIEDFSGVKCANCPDAAHKIKALEDANPGRIAEIVMHSSFDGSLTDSFTDSKSSFRNIDSDNLRSELGGPNVLPEIAINRKLFPTQNRIAFDRNNMQTYFNNELSLNSIASINFVSKSYDLSTATIKMTILVQYGGAIQDTDYFSVAITESKIIDPQDSNGIEVKNYVHNNVLRKYVYPSNGIPLISKFPGQTYSISYNTTIPLSWNTDNLKIVAILHKQNATTNNFYVSQVNEVSLK